MDFALWGPNNQRFQEKIKYEGHKFDPVSGNWSKTALPGPKSYDEWWKCWRVLEVALLLLDAVKPESLRSYADRIRQFNADYGHRCWFIIYQADVTMRAEQFERIRREAQVVWEATPVDERSKLRYQPEKPWSHILSCAASEQHSSTFVFWDRHVHRKCNAFLAAQHPPPAPHPAGRDYNNNDVAPYSRRQQ